ncbi:hypothetical protein GCK72_026109 [Caenorhabditis remanei]|uniref:Uncharacterized protein n=1 Tax=Caenorhabditis remanei TaxID=31234 RepID=A0A6A5G4J1_CAERE|nr:hypothetical protein GCK72_026109 [Caenorhabditis remanei]KAF1749641.1 hypothetical protein GCK72_026109 [Caenorhabditis remanei]
MGWLAETMVEEMCLDRKNCRESKKYIQMGEKVYNIFSLLIREDGPLQPQRQEPQPQQNLQEDVIVEEGPFYMHSHQPHHQQGASQNQPMLPSQTPSPEQNALKELEGINRDLQERLKLRETREAELEEKLKQVEKQEEIKKVADGFKKEEMELKDAEIARLTRQVEMLQGVTQHLVSRAQHRPLRPPALQNQPGDPDRTHSGHPLRANLTTTVSTSHPENDALHIGPINLFSTKKRAQQDHQAEEGLVMYKSGHIKSEPV